MKSRQRPERSSPFAEPVGQALLESDTAGRSAQRIVSSLTSAGHKSQHARLFRADRLSRLPFSEPAEYGGNAHRAAS